jgi:tripartite-type tricarboxylate transporter receptor subunit TctC
LKDREEDRQINNEPKWTLDDGRQRQKTNCEASHRGENIGDQRIYQNKQRGANLGSVRIVTVFPDPSKISYASAGSGTSLHMAGELFKMMAGVDMVHVPYRSSAPALTDLLGGQVQMLFSPLPSSIEYVRTGRLRALATTGAARSSALPDTPIVGDFLPDYEASAWYGVCAPGNTSAEIVDKLNKEINAGLADAKLKARLAELGSSPFVASPSEFGKHLAEQTEKWGRVVKAANLKTE